MFHTGGPASNPTRTVQVSSPATALLTSQRRPADALATSVSQNTAAGRQSPHHGTSAPSPENNPCESNHRKTCEHMRTHTSIHPEHLKQKRTCKIQDTLPLHTRAGDRHCTLQQADLHRPPGNNTSVLQRVERRRRGRQAPPRGLPLVREPLHSRIAFVLTRSSNRRGRHL